MAKKFDLSQYIDKAESKMDTLPRLTAVELHLIDPSATNFYSMPGIEQLADNIATVGLLEPPRVREKDGRYVLVSGHRRLAALRLLVERGEKDPHDLIPVFLDEEPDPGEARDKDAARIALRQLRLIYANSDNRQYSSADKTREVQELSAIFAELKRLGYEFPGKLREHVAAAAHVSESRAARLAVIGKNLTAPHLREAYESGRLGENAAYEIARRGADVIGRVDELPMAQVCGMTIERLGAVLEGLEKKAQEDAEEAKAYNDGVKAMGAAPVGGGLPDAPQTDPENGPPRASAPTDNPAASPFRSSFDADEYIRERTAEDLRYLDMAGALLDQLIHSIPGVIHNRREGIDALKHALRWSSLGGASVNYEGRGSGLELYRRGSSERLLRSWTEAYDALCTAAINRLGKNSAWDGEEPEDDEDEDESPSRCAAARFRQGGQVSPDPEWMTGIPPRRGRYFCRVDMGDSKPHENRCWWGNDGWSCYGSNLKANGWKVVGWWPLPKEG